MARQRQIQVHFGCLLGLELGLLGHNWVLGHLYRHTTSEGLCKRIAGPKIDGFLGCIDGLVLDPFGDMKAVESTAVVGGSVQIVDSDDVAALEHMDRQHARVGSDSAGCHLIRLIVGKR